MDWVWIWDDEREELYFFGSWHEKNGICIATTTLNLTCLMFNAAGPVRASRPVKTVVAIITNAGWWDR